MDGLYRIDRRTCACTNGAMMDDLYLIDRRTCACTNSSNQRKKMEKRLPNSSADPCATSPIPSSRICSRRSFPTSKTDACLVTRFDVGCVTSRHERRMALTETQAYVCGVCMHNLCRWCVPLEGGMLDWPPSPRLTVRRSTARPPLPTPPNGWEGNARDARYVTRRTGDRRGSVNSRSTAIAQNEGGLSVARLLLSRTGWEV